MGPEAENVHSALVSAVSKGKMSDLTESLALTESLVNTKSLAHGMKFLLAERYFSDSESAL